MAAGVERMLDAREPHLYDEPYEGGIQEQAYQLWRAYRRDPQAWGDSKDATAPR